MNTVDNFSYKTNIRFDLEIIKKETEEYQNDATATKTSKNNAASLCKRLLSFKQGDMFMGGGDPKYFDDVMTGTSKGNTARVYYNPSYTQYPRVVRKAIVPMNPENKFVYLDIKSAEYILNCIFAGDEKTLEIYRTGGDPYLAYSDEFPEGTTRDQMKTALIANMYGMSAFTLAKRLGISESAAKQILKSINRSRPAQAMLNMSITMRAINSGAYYCPNGIKKDDILKVADIDPEVGYSENRALSVYTQSALGVWMQSKIREVQEFVEQGSTLITVFDSILFEVNKQADEEQIKSQLKALVSPFRADIGFGVNFYEAQNSAH